MKKIILISGINGFLARYITSLLEADYKIYGIGRDDSAIDGITVFSSAQIDTIEIIPDFVILCHAAISSGEIQLSQKLLFEVNVQLTDNICRKFSNAKIIFASTASIFDNNCEVIHENSKPGPQTDYAFSKYWGESLVIKNTNSIIVRYSSIYGIGMNENTIIPKYVNQAIKNKCIKVWGKGERMQNYIHVKDAALLIKNIIIDFDNLNKKLFLGVGTMEHSNIELANIIAEKTSAVIEFINSDQTKSLKYNNDFSAKQTQWSAKVDFKKAVINYLEWKQKQY